MAGLWTTWTKPDGKKLYTCTIVTTQANKQMSKIHDRMPVILDKKAEKTWLNPDIIDLNELKKLLHTTDVLDLNIYPVTNQIGSPSFNTMECISPIKINEAPSLF
jgi:putative SOS response-associated peptidase YedK